MDSGMHSPNFGLPASAPKTRVKSPGRAKGDKPSLRPRYSAVKKRTSKCKKSEQSLNRSKLVVA